MNPETLLTMAAKAIETRQATRADNWHLCYFDGRIQCLPTWHYQGEHPVFLVLHSLELESGLSTEQWNTLRTELTKFWKEVKT